MKSLVIGLVRASRRWTGPRRDASRKQGMADPDSKLCLSCGLLLLMGCWQQPVERAGSSAPSRTLEPESFPSDRLNVAATNEKVPSYQEPTETQYKIPLQVEARGSRRAWQFSYVGLDGILGTDDDRVSSGDLRLPAGADVVIQLRSDDYIYVFSCPGLKLKEIAVPDLEFSIAFRADRNGQYDLAMDPMCGFRLPPGETMGTLRVVPEREFRTWLGARPRLQ